MFFTEFDFGSPTYDESVHLRNKILRKPLNMVFYAQDLAQEYNSYHIGAIHSSFGLLASLVLVPKGEGVFKMRQVAVDESFQGKRIGTQLVVYSEEILKELGAVKIVLNAREPAVTFYQRMGYDIVSEKFIEVTIPHFAMEKLLIF